MTCVFGNLELGAARNESCIFWEKSQYDSDEREQRRKDREARLRLEAWRGVYKQGEDIGSADMLRGDHAKAEVTRFKKCTHGRARIMWKRVHGTQHSVMRSRAVQSLFWGCRLCRVTIFNIRCGKHLLKRAALLSHYIATTGTATRHLTRNQDDGN